MIIWVAAALIVGFVLGAIEGRAAVAKRIAQRKWTHGQSPLITRADVEAETL